VRWTSYTIDTTLLTAAMMLLTILPWAMFGNGWLAVKLVLLVVYIVLGILALRPQRTRPARAGFYRRCAAGVADPCTRSHGRTIPWDCQNPARD
jgi:uncharacterized membrane protein SirB2